MVVFDRSAGLFFKCTYLSQMPGHRFAVMKLSSVFVWLQQGRQTNITMQLTKIQFAILLMALLVLPFFGYKAVWLLRSIPAKGTMCFMGKSLNGQLSSTYPVIRFRSLKGDTIYFNGANELMYERGEIIPVRYQESMPAEARIYSFAGLWLDTVIYALVPFLLLLIVFLHPEIIPRRSKIIIGKKALVKIVPPQ